MQIGLEEGVGAIASLIVVAAGGAGLVELIGKAGGASLWRIIDPVSGEIAPARRAAAFGLRYRGLPYVGFASVQRLMASLAPALKAAYGGDYQHVARALYRGGGDEGALASWLRQGVRLGLARLSTAQIGHVAAALIAGGAADADAIAAAARASDPRGEAAMARFVAALDARIEAALALARTRYQASARAWAGAACLGLALVGGGALGADMKAWLASLVIGAGAIPLAPVLKDLAARLARAARHG